MASGDPFTLVQEASAVTTFSYTAAAGVWFVITSCGGDSVRYHLNTWVPSTSGVYRIVESNIVTGINNVKKVIFGNGTSITGSDPDIAWGGVYITGIEL